MAAYIFVAAKLHQLPTNSWDLVQELDGQQDTKSQNIYQY
jgi:hypothetical protein